MIRDVKVIRQEQSIPNHKLIICVLDLKEGLDKHRMEFVKRCKVWKLREQMQTRAALVWEKPRGVKEEFQGKSD